VFILKLPLLVSGAIVVQESVFEALKMRKELGKVNDFARIRRTIVAALLR
jgi:hypothetical protein